MMICSLNLILYKKKEKKGKIERGLYEENPSIFSFNECCHYDSTLPDVETLKYSLQKSDPNSDLFASVDDILCVGQAIDAWPTDDRVVPWRSMGHFHCAELQEGFAQGNATEQHLPA